MIIRIPYTTDKGVTGLLQRTMFQADDRSVFETYLAAAA